MKSVKLEWSKFGVHYVQIGAVAKASFLGFVFFQRVGDRFQIFGICGELQEVDNENPTNNR